MFASKQEVVIEAVVAVVIEAVGVREEIFVAEEIFETEVNWSGSSVG